MLLGAQVPTHRSRASRSRLQLLSFDPGAVRGAGFSRWTAGLADSHSETVTHPLVHRNEYVGDQAVEIGNCTNKFIPTEFLLLLYILPDTSGRPPGGWDLKT